MVRGGSTRLSAGFSWEPPVPTVSVVRVSRTLPRSGPARVRKVPPSARSGPAASWGDSRRPPTAPGGRVPRHRGGTSRRPPTAPGGPRHRGGSLPAPAVRPAGGPRGIVGGPPDARQPPGGGGPRGIVEGPPGARRPPRGTRGIVGGLPTPAVRPEGAGPAASWGCLPAERSRDQGSVLWESRPEAGRVPGGDPRTGRTWGFARCGAWGHLPRP